MIENKLEVVIVDDEIQITELLKSFIMISVENVYVHTFNNPLNAKLFLKNNKPDILITDYKMPDIDGVQLLKCADPSVKKVMISGYISEIAAEKIQELNVTCFEKPVPLKKLADIIQELETKINA
ncbi:hypothetical protein CHISP_2069 [Chitinispirillum alkaliphilum]|nr:hypothetical protein CHISP_2069 [Chitinispirillum alkaliphilum]